MEKQKVEVCELENKQSNVRICNRGNMNELKQKVLSLEMANKLLLEENKRLKAQAQQEKLSEPLPLKSSHCAQLCIKLKQKYQAQKRLTEEYKQKLDKAAKSLEIYRIDNGKQLEKIKKLKKERDNLKVDNLRQRQEYMNKCESYREIKSTLRRKLKMKEDAILKLQRRIESINRNEVSSSYAESYSRAKSLESTSKHPLKNLASIIQLEELSSEFDKQPKGLVELGSKSLAEDVPHNTERKNQRESVSSDEGFCSNELVAKSIVTLFLKS
eukprot:TRINITY_DN12531_c0_g2_i1.p1 TRINITY_DN12531_c0_g2~~TRINITY_DN12531_c0_g2_i1.p1  ORF type:complete len:306 (-),score=61.33 TRINITY_DN12531_c0_g2_i1:569-1381(-)